MKAKNLFLNNKDKKLHEVHFGPGKLIREGVRFDKELFLAEYNTLRSEIVQRLSQQTTITQISFTAWGAILAVAIRSNDSNLLDHINSLFNTSFIILVYPLLGYFISFSWAFQNTRICQIGSYLRYREEEATKIWGILYWERHILNQDMKNKKKPEGKISQGITIFLGTQISAILIALLILILTIIYFNNAELIPGFELLDEHLKSQIENTGIKSYFTSILILFILLIIDSYFTYKTYYNIKNSGNITE